MFILSLLLAAQADPLADLTRRSAELKSFRATGELSGSLTAGAARIRMEYVAPARARTERIQGEQRMSTWCVDGVVAMVGTGGEKALYGRADSAPAFAALEPVESALRAAFPHARARPPAAAAIGMRWGFEPKTKQPNFAIDAHLAAERVTPFGWLQTLEQKRAVAREDGELLRFETDDAFHVALSKHSGFVAEFTAVTPQGELKLADVSVELDAAIEPARFELPARVPDAVDTSPDLLRAVQKVADECLRERIYEAIAGEGSPSAWDDAFQEKVGSVLRPFHEQAVARILESTITRWTTIRENIAKRLAGMRTEGKSEAEVEQVRQRELGNLKKQLDELEQGFATRLALPGNAPGLPRAGELLALETRILRAAIAAKVRGPMLEAYERETKP